MIEPRNYCIYYINAIVKLRSNIYFSTSLFMSNVYLLGLRYPHFHIICSLRGVECNFLRASRAGALGSFSITYVWKCRFYRHVIKCGVDASCLRANIRYLFRTRCFAEKRGISRLANN